MPERGLELAQRRLPQSDQEYPDDSDKFGFLDAHADRRVQALRRRVLLLSVLTCLSLVLSIAGLSYMGSIDPHGVAQGGSRAGVGGTPLGHTPLVKDKTVKRIAFGSCTSHLLDEQSIWTEGVVASEPDAWIWLGDMAYLDSPFAKCINSTEDMSQCNCTADWLRTPSNCMVGDLDHAREKMRRQLLSRGYQRFLQYMCPDFLQYGMFPPAGADPQACPRPIIGTYDDHDYGWNNGDRRLPGKSDMKQIFLDAVGEAPNSPRRSTAQGIQWKYTFNEGKPDRLIDVYLLDERYERDTLPCHLRRDWCNDKVLKNPDDSDYAWCKDFVVDGGVQGTGSCCTSDERFSQGWCMQADAKSDPIWPYLCDPTSDAYATLSSTASSSLLFQNGTPLAFEVPDWDTADEVSPICEVLGPRQRQWLSDSLARSTAPLTVIGSGSVVLGNPFHQRKHGRGICSDDWDCYHPAQLQLLHTLAKGGKGCVVIVTGDYHISDIKMMDLEEGKPYTEHYMANQLDSPIYQVMASGMTNETAKHQFDDEPCREWRNDTAGLRPLGQCSFVPTPAFGMLDIDWDARIVHLKIMDGRNGKRIASGFDKTLQKLSFDLDSCKRV